MRGFENIDTCDALKFFEIFCGGEKKHLNIPSWWVMRERDINDINIYDYWLVSFSGRWDLN